MEKEIGRICAEGLAFFGKTNRLISHELKNVFAIISETLGLMEELLALPGTDVDLIPGKLHSLSVSILEEVGRANNITRSMNTFAHSVDTFVKETDVKQTVMQVIELMKLDSVAKNTNFRLSGSESCMIHTSPFFLIDLIYHVTHTFLHGVGPGKEIRISFDSDDGYVRIAYSGLTGMIEEFPTKRQRFLARVVSAKLSLDTSSGELNIILPKTMGESPIQHLLSDAYVSG